MQNEKRDNSNDYYKQIGESIANAEERRKQALEEDDCLSEKQLDELSGGIDIGHGHTAGMISYEEKL